MLLDVEARVRRLGNGYAFVEGPVWHPTERYLLFSDIPGDPRRRWDASGVVEVARPTPHANGMTFDRNLNLVVCEHSTSCIARFDRAGLRSVLATHFEGRELNSPNDVVVRADGSIYFTDPMYGRMPGYGLERRSELGFQGVYRLPVEGDLELVVEREMFTQPKGLCFSPDETLLYINDTDQANIRVFDVRPDGRLENPREFASGLWKADTSGTRNDDLGVPDGMKCDAAGNVWVTAPGGLWVFAPNGQHIGTIGGPGWSTLFLTASTSLYSIETRTSARLEPFMQPGG